MVLAALLGIDLPPLVLVALTLVVILLVRSWTNKKAPVNLPPFPVKGYPILGHLPYLGKDARGTIMQWSKETGEIFSLYFGTTYVVVLSSFEVLRETLVKKADLFTDKPRTSMFPAVVPVSEIGGVIETSDQQWKENRSLILSSLRSFGMGRNLMAEKVKEEINAYMNEIDKLKGKPVDMKNLTSRAISNVICNFLLGKRFDYDDEYYKQFLEIYDTSTELAGAGRIHMWFPILRFVPGDLFGIRKQRRNDRNLRNFEREFVQQVEDEESSGINKDNIISYYLKEMNSKIEHGKTTMLTKKDLMTCIGDLLTAGSETATSTILWFYLYMIHHPEIQAKVHAEIDHEIGTSRAPVIGDKTKLVYTNAAIMETQRISSIVPLGLFHRCTEETVVRGYTIPKDTFIMPHLDSVLLSEKIWGDPHKFRPERFIDDQGRLMNPEEFVPFSMGRRLCVGEGLARAELFLYITHIFQRYKCVPEDPENLPPIDAHVGVTSAPRSYKVRIVERDA